MDIEIGRASSLNPRDLEAMHRLRHRVFRERMQWDVPASDGIERDSFDAQDPIYLLVKDQAHQVTGCWRMLPTSGPTMLRDVFAATLCGHPAPCDAAVWELSRFALSSHEGRAHQFSQTALAMMERVVEFALSKQVTCFVTVVDVAIERLMRTLRIPTRRIGVPVPLGSSRSVALSIEVSLNTLLLLRRRAGADAVHTCLAA